MTPLKSSRGTMPDTDLEKPDEVEARMNGALKRALATKPTPHKPTPKGEKRPK